MAVDAPSARREFRCGVSGPSSAPVSPTTLMTAVGNTQASAACGYGRALAAEYRVRFEQLRPVDGGGLVDVGQVEAAALSEEGERIVPDDVADRLFRNPVLPHDRDRLGNLQWVADAPVSSAVDDDA